MSQDGPAASAVIIFLGPTLTVAEAREELDAIYLPPVSQGDVYSSATRRPRVIGIVDGYFERVPAVWHKEILWAMAGGIHVWGSASMGALRAAELARFGMRGTGRVFEAFAAGDLQDDDEVAVLHGPPESGFLPLSEAMVDIRCSLAAALAAGVLTEAAHFHLIELAKSLFYAERSYSRILARAAEMPTLRPFCEPVAAWLATGKVGQKREDAREMLRRISEELSALAAPVKVKYFFQNTSVWQALRLQGGRAPELRLAAGSHLPDIVLEELRLAVETCRNQKQEAMIRLLALSLAERENLRVDPGTRAEAIHEWRRKNALCEAEDLDRWLETQDLDHQAFERLVEQEILAERVCLALTNLLETSLRDQLRLEGRYSALRQRGLAKQRELAARGQTNPSLIAAGLTEDQVWQWYFDERLATERPANLEAYAEGLGFLSLDAMRQAVLREYLYTRKLPGS